VFNDSTPSSSDPVADLASDVLIDLYRAVCGHRPKAVRAYHDDDALLLLLRFDPAELLAGDEEDHEHLLEGAFVAMPGMIASAVEARCGHRMVPGNLSVCGERGLAVFAFSADETQDADGDEDIFSFEAAFARDAQGNDSLRLAG
jgi:hypothetical protein